MHDLAIGGAGPAGIAAAYFLRDLKLDVTILEAGDEVGGRTRSVPVGGIPSNTGALFVYRDTPAEELAAELGIRTAAFTPDTYGIHVNNETVVDSDNHRLIDQLPISFTAREQLRAFVHSSLDEYEQFTQARQITDEAGGLAGLTIAERLRGLEPKTVAIITSAIKGGSVADPSELSARASSSPAIPRSGPPRSSRPPRSTTTPTCWPRCRAGWVRPWSASTWRRSPPRTDSRVAAGKRAQQPMWNIPGA